MFILGILFTVKEHLVAKAQEILQDLSLNIAIRTGCAKVVVGAGMMVALSYGQHCRSFIREGIPIYSQLILYYNMVSG